MAKTTEKALPFDEALMRLDGTDEPDDGALRALTGMDATQLAQFDKIWRALDGDRRAAIAAKLRVLMLEDAELDFFDIFRNGLADADARVRDDSVLGLWELESPSLIAPLVKLLRDDPVPAVRASAAKTLGYFMYLNEVERISKARGSEIYAALMYVLRHAPEDTPLYQRALESIGYAGTGDVEFFLRSAFASDDAQLKLSAVIGMGRSDNQAYQPLVRAELQSVSPAIRREAARAAGELEDVDAVKELGELIEDTDNAVAEAALEALAQIGGPDAKRLLESTAASADGTLKQKADESLQMYEMLHGDFDFNVKMFDEDSRTSFHSIKPDALPAKKKRKTDE